MRKKKNAIAAAQVAEIVRGTPTHNLPTGWWKWPAAIEAHQMLAREFLAQLPAFPTERFSGRGIVICAGGHCHFTNAWVCLRMLRHLGCALPVQLWHFEGEVDRLDFHRMERARPMWRAAEVPYRDEPEVESGQIALDKARCWQALNLAMHYNEHSDFYFKYIHGDKCTFQFAWPRTGTRYAMPGRGIHAIELVPLGRAGARHAAGFCRHGRQSDIMGLFAL